MNLNIKQRFLNWVDETQTIRPSAIVLHWWQAPIWRGGIDYLISVLKRRKLSVQFAVLANGDIYQLVSSPTVLCHHAKCANKSSIGIEIQGRGKKDLDSHEEQFKSVVRLVHKLCRDYEITSKFRFDEKSTRFYGITSHKQVDKHCVANSIKKDVHDEYLGKVIKAVNNLGIK